MGEGERERGREGERERGREGEREKNKYLISNYQLPIPNAQLPILEYKK
ncbi:MAG: hypothetical protein AAFS12_06340 [Cyanobacteria bacterium J06632_19]